MAQVNSSDIFPSIRGISTNELGDLQEIISSPEASSTLTLYGDVFLTAQTAGLSGDDITIEVSDNSGVADAVTVVGNAISVELEQTLTPPSGGTPSVINYNTGFNLTHVGVGPTNIQFSVVDQINNGAAAQASCDATDYTLTKDAKGAFAGTLTVTDSSGNADNASIAGTDITLALEFAINTYSIQDVIDELNTLVGFTATVNSGINATDTASLLSSTNFQGGADDIDVVKVHATDSDISVCLANDISTYNNQDIFNLLSAANLAAVCTLGGLANPNVTAINTVQTFDNGAPQILQTNATTDIVDLINESADASVLISATGGSVDLPTTLSATNMENGADATLADLSPSSEYVMIKTSDIHSLLPSEIGDGRKIFWGVLESYAQHVLGLSVESQPENLILTRGNPSLVIDAAGTRIRQSYSVQSYYATGDFDLEAETSV